MTVQIRAAQLQPRNIPEEPTALSHTPTPLDLYTTLKQLRNRGISLTYVVQ